ncbi:SMP-30/gluconolactonase/LRE family protein [Aliidiomarina soli]|uniref:Gluconolaconase n=1 Tax=Aliidiomarina soli TaxID=1928574 RepID=A0A432WF81_9GAMM|nr:SMP-30/gluconolactonase/LRE family protein [Aliidiomarina soli]RUO32443.1 gluconolaconase [Aliidiomarina soli]
MDNCQFIGSIDVANRLGEGIVWHAQTETLWWTDIHGCQLHRYHWHSRRLETWTTPERLTAFSVITTDPIKMVVSFASGFAIYEPESQQVQWLARPELETSGHRFNDGRTDRQGRFWSATMVEHDEGKQGSLYRLNANGCSPVLEGFAIPNALCWNPEGTRMYHADTPTGVIQQYDFEPANGTPSNPRVFASVPRGEPDGATVDAQGDLWVALWGGSGVARFNPHGQLQGVLDLPVSQPTCVAFGGPDMNILFVTSATEGLTEAQKANEPLAGSVLIYQTHGRGLPEPGVTTHD